MGVPGRAPGRDADVGPGEPSPLYSRRRMETPARSSGANGGAIVAAALERAGVRHLFTLCGGHISPILVECKRRGLGVVDVRGEANAVFAADAVARMTGIPGVAAV